MDRFSYNKLYDSVMSYKVKFHSELADSIFMNGRFECGISHQEAQKSFPKWKLTRSIIKRLRILRRMKKEIDNSVESTISIHHANDMRTARLNEKAYKTQKYYINLYESISFDLNQLQVKCN